MQPILDLGIKFVLALQSLGTWLVIPMQLFSFLGTEECFLIFAPVIYWCIDSRLGFRLSLYLMISTGLNDALKIFWHASRPYWIDPRVKALSVETSFGLPSGHSMMSATVWGALAASLRKLSGWIISLLIIFLVGLSRLYLGMHFPTDVLTGWLLAALLVVFFFWIDKPVVNWLKGQSITQKIILAFVLSLSLVALGLFARYSIEAWVIPSIWVQNAATATGIAEPINPLDPKVLISSAGALAGLATGYFLLENSGGFQTSGTLSQKFLRFCIGLVGIVVFWKGLGMFLPTGLSFVAFGLRYVRYCLIGMWVTGGAPWVFIRFGLSKKAT